MTFIIVGWVERSETQHQSWIALCPCGHASLTLNPTYEEVS
ncbi:MAG: hypothetical protein SWZ49_01215 [Cyanobacteriota bacterium]|nr:hypothetical protein [Cyanobacteriota bacterium]